MSILKKWFGFEVCVDDDIARELDVWRAQFSELIIKQSGLSLKQAINLGDEALREINNDIETWSPSDAVWVVMRSFVSGKPFDFDDPRVHPEYVPELVLYGA